MKQINPIAKLFVLVLFVFSAAISCNTTRYAALPCPDLPDNYPGKKYASVKIRKNKKVFAFNQKKNKRPGNRKATGLFARNNRNASQATLVSERRPSGSHPSEVNIEYSNTGYTNGVIDPVYSLELPPPSDEFEYIEPASSEVDNNITPGYYATYTAVPGKDFKLTRSPFNASTISKELVPQQSFTRVEPLGLAGLIAGLVGLFIAGIPLGVLATVFGVVGLGKINQNPEVFTGRGIAIASIILGIVDILGVLVLLLLL